MNNTIERYMPLIFITILFSGFGYVFFIALPGSLKEDFINKCLDNSGVPVNVMTHVKGYREGWNCVEPSKTINTGEK